MNFLLKKIAYFILMFIGITLISFFVVHLVPGSPVDAKSEMNPKMTAQAKEKLSEVYGLDKPLMTQYASWFSRVARLDFGNSFMDGEKVLKKIGAALPVTLGINLLVLLLILFIGIPLGVFGAVYKDSLGDKTVNFLTFAAFSIPTFWLALTLMSFFGVQLRWLPISGIHSIFYDHLTPWGKFLDVSKHLVLPVFTGCITALAAISRYTRSSMIQVLKSLYIRTARAKGLAEGLVVWKHGLRNALLPMITVLGLWIPGLLGGSVVFESVFSIPGMGRLFYQSVFSRDYPVIMGILVLGSILTLLANMVTDLLYAVADPRIRKEGSSS